MVFEFYTLAIFHAKHNSVLSTTLHLILLKPLLLKQNKCEENNANPTTFFNGILCLNQILFPKKDNGKYCFLA